MDSYIDTISVAGATYEIGCNYNKIDKLIDATSGNIPVIDYSGGLTDSDVPITSVVTSLTLNSGTPITPVNNTINIPKVSTSGPGLVTALPVGATGKFLDCAGNWSVPTNTKNTAGATNSTSTLYLIGATYQTTYTNTYSNSNVYETNGVLHANQFEVPSGGGLSCNGDPEITLCSSTNTRSIDISAEFGDARIYLGGTGGPSSYIGVLIESAQVIKLNADDNAGVTIDGSGSNALDYIGVKLFGEKTEVETNLMHVGGPVKVSNGLVSSGCTMQYDSTEQCMKFIFS